MYHILIVDEEEHLLWALERNLFPNRDDIEVHTADSGEEGLEILDRESIDLLISDIKMPGKVDGFQLILRAKEKVPDARVMIITAFGTHRIQNFAERIGISHYIEKPFTVDELRNSVLEILNEKEGFQGVLSDLELTDIIQMLCLAKRTALLHLKHRDHRGRIVFEAGDVVHAEFDGTVGPEAVYEMLDLRQGDIFMQSDFSSGERTIDIGWQDLLLEGVKRADEQRLEREQERTRKKREEAKEKAQEKEESENTRRTKTPIGMGAASIVTEAEGIEEEQEKGQIEEEPSGAMLFSEEELQEISRASEAALEEASAQREDEPPEEDSQENLQVDEETTEFEERDEADEGDIESDVSEPVSQEGVAELNGEAESDMSIAEMKTVTDFDAKKVLEAAKLDDDADVSVAPALGHRAPGTALAEESETAASVEESEFKSGRRKRSGTSPGMTAVTSGSQQTEESGEFALFAAPTFNGKPESTEASSPAPPEEGASALREFAEECPGVRATGLLSRGRGELVQWIQVDGDADIDRAKVASTALNLFSRAQRSVTTLRDGDELEEVQLVLPEEYLLMRLAKDGSTIHVVLVEREVSLGIALVLMRQFEHGQDEEGM